MFSFLLTIKGQKTLVPANNLIFKFKSTEWKEVPFFFFLKSFDFLSVGFLVLYLNMAPSLNMVIWSFAISYVVILDSGYLGAYSCPS